MTGYAAVSRSFVHRSPWGAVAARVLVAAVVALSVLGSGVDARAAAPVAFEVDGVEIVTHDGRRYDFTVEIARTPTQRARGLMYRREMAPDHGMLFDFGGIGPRAFWMKNTYLSLDILFLESDGRIWRIAADTTPLSEETITARGPIRAVLELRAGTCRLLGIEVGDQVRHALFGNTAPDAGTD